MFNPFVIIFSMLLHTAVLELQPINSTSEERKLLLISFDGFRHDYLEKALASGVNISAFQKIWSSGFRVMRVQNEFVTRTAPSHFSLVTGQHQETHGVVDNAFYDPYFNKTFVFKDPVQSTESDLFDNGGEPIWITNQLHGHRSGVTNWPGSLAKIKGMKPSISYPKFDPTFALRGAFNDVLKWLEGEVNLALLYFRQPDSAGHKWGPNSAEVLHSIRELNNDLDDFLQRVDSSPILKNTLNIIVTSDHGMAEIDPSRTIFLNDYLNETMYFSTTGNVKIIWGLWPKPGYTPNDILSRLQNKHSKMNVFLKEDIPRRLYYNNNRRIAPVLAYAEPGWLITKTKNDADALTNRGDHGYDPASPDMSPFFLATGPGFQTFPPNHTIPCIKTLDIYPMMCSLLGLDNPGPHNGSLSRVEHLLRKPTD